MKTLSLYPTEDRILVLPDKVEEKTPGGIVLPDIAKHGKPVNKGTVVAVGPGRMVDDGSRLPMYVKVGDRVRFSPYGVSETHEEDGEEYSILRQSEVTGIYKMKISVKESFDAVGVE